MSNAERLLEQGQLPKRRRRLWRTLFHRPRDIAPFAPPVSFEEVASPPPQEAQVAHWGEVILLEDHASILHRDGTITYSVHHIALLQGDLNLAPWDQVSWVYDAKIWRPT